jgi:hypothetical protein
LGGADLLEPRFQCGGGVVGTRLLLGCFGGQQFGAAGPRGLE